MDLVKKASMYASTLKEHILLKDLNPTSSRYHIIKGWNVIGGTEVEQFGKEVLHSFGLDETFKINHLKGTSGLTAYGVGSWVIAQSRNRSVKSVLNDFKKLIIANRATYLEFVVLWGVQVDKTIKLGIEDIKLMPIKSLPFSDYRDYLWNVPVLKQPLDFIFPEKKPKATALLVHQYEIYPLISKQNSIVHNEHLSRVELMELIAKMLVLAVKVPVIPFMHWSQPVPSTPFLLTGSGGATLNNNILNQVPKKHTIPSKMGLIVKDYLNLSNEQRKKFDIPLSRLNSALCLLQSPRDKNDFIEAAIDLGIAMESFLLPDEESELAYRFALRGALWLNEDIPKTRASLKEFYRKIRSKVVHTGNLSTLPIEKQITMIQDGIEVFIKMLRKAIGHGGIPEWSKLEEKT